MTYDLYVKKIFCNKYNSPIKLLFLNDVKMSIL